MKTSKTASLAMIAVHAMAEIAAAKAAFDRGETNLFDALDAIVVSADAYRAAMLHKRPRPRIRRDAA